MPTHRHREYHTPPALLPECLFSLGQLFWIGALHSQTTRLAFSENFEKRQSLPGYFTLFAAVEIHRLYLSGPGTLICLPVRFQPLGGLGPRCVRPFLAIAPGS